MVAVLVHERVRVRLGLESRNRDHPAAVAPARALTAPVDELGRRNELDSDSGDLVRVRCGAQQRGIPLHVDAFGSYVEPNRPALVVLDDDLLSRCLAGEREREREERGDEDERAAHEPTVTKRGQDFIKTSGVCRPISRAIVPPMGIGAILVIIGIIVLFVKSLILGLVLILIGLAFGGFRRGSWY